MLFQNRTILEVDSPRQVIIHLDAIDSITTLDDYTIFCTGSGSEFVTLCAS